MIKSKPENEMGDMVRVDVDNVITMSSLEIAELTGKQHRNVTVDIEKMLSDLNLPTAEFSAVYKADNNQEYRCFNLPKRETLILVSGYSVALRAKIIDRWQELENRPNTPQLPDFTNPAESARAWAEQFEKREIAEQKNIQLEHKIEEDKEKVGLAEALLNLGEKDGRVKLKVFAKCVEDVYGVGRNSLYQTLEDMKIWGKDRIPFARFIQNGMFSVKLESWNNSKTGCQGTNIIVHINPKGMQYLIKKLSALLDTDDI